MTKVRLQELSRQIPLDKCRSRSKFVWTRATSKGCLPDHFKRSRTGGHGPVRHSEWRNRNRSPLVRLQKLQRRPRRIAGLRNRVLPRSERPARRRTIRGRPSAGPDHPTASTVDDSFSNHFQVFLYGADLASPLAIPSGRRTRLMTRQGPAHCRFFVGPQQIRGQRDCRVGDGRWHGSDSLTPGGIAWVRGLIFHSRPMERNETRGETMRSLVTFWILVSSIAFGNDGSGEAVPSGGLQLRREARISMEKERLIIGMERVAVEYEFLNPTGQDITTEVLFPLPAEHLNFSPRPLPILGWHVWVERKRITLPDGGAGHQLERYGSNRLVAPALDRHCVARSFRSTA